MRFPLAARLIEFAVDGRLIISDGAVIYVNESFNIPSMTEGFTNAHSLINAVQHIHQAVAKARRETK